MRIKINKGDKFITKNEGNAFGHLVMLIKEVTKIENGLDAMVHFTTPIVIHRRKNHTARFWWFRDYCKRCYKAKAGA